ncbi:armadillo beta-catenin plakoglobin [Meredithblackwellia eburnea MCA 4105]
MPLPRELSPPAASKMHKNMVLAEAGRAPWYRADGTPVEAYLIGIAGGSASGKTRVAQAILKELGVPWVLVIAQDMFYKSLTREQSKKAFQNDYDFDSPDAFDYDILRKCIEDMKASRSVQIPNYSFVLHQRTEETTYLYGAAVIIVEGIFALHDPAIRELMDLKIFVQCDSDLMLARRLRRDLLERGRDAGGVLDQYLRFVKPSFDNFVQPTAKFADVIVPGERNERSIQVVVSHIRRQLDERRRDLRKELVEMAAYRPGGNPENRGKAREESGKPEVPDSVFVMKPTSQLKGIHTLLRDRETSLADFIFLANRLSTLVIEHALSFLPHEVVDITTRTQLPYQGARLNIPLCGVSILRSGASLEKGLRRVLRDIPVGSMLIQSTAQLPDPHLYHLELPGVITSSRESAASAWVLLLDSQIGTGSAAMMAIRVLLDHGVREEQIIFCCILVSKVGGVWAIKDAFPGVRVVTSEVDEGLEERWIWPESKGTTEDGSAKQSSGTETAPKRVFAILPGLGSFGDRYYGT